MKKLIVTVFCVAAVGAILAGCGEKVDADEVNSKVQPSTTSKVGADGSQGQGGGVVADMSIDR